MDVRYTKRQVARGSRPDVAVDGTAYLLKRVSHLRLTYQIRLLTFMAEESGERLVIRVPRQATTSDDLREFVRQHRRYVRIERVDS
ncbi:hypothetical protein Q3W71_04600 [Micromonospora sp. C28SCA-DRY-2]|uniref:hypothetical protein n=1 Tax=Micromonospora sp. C28SCA-DRY-2 TaxID=3059522 RepID=UPI0026746299|nr:hypothetical protein [Micromonospora sp. C28SCA-DRY-2]MDO3700957.1 hypothetical protein [Micromonospora sp. C28SCA-DRY-2]